mgnify:CR=1 FL=1
MSSGSRPDGAEAEARRAFSVILARLTRRDHTEAELSRALGRMEFSPEAVEAALARAGRDGLINDARVAGALARAGAASGRRGPRRVLATLRLKGIAPETAAVATKAAFEDSEVIDTKVARLAERLLRRARGTTPRERRLKAVRSLMSRGFPLADARRAVSLAENALINENRKDDADE